MTRRVAVLAVWTSCALGTSPAAQDLPTPPLVELDVIVSDARARAIPDLTSADFVVHEAGAPRVVQSVRVSGGRPRIVGVLLDEFHVTAGEPSRQVRAALSESLLSSLRPDDAIAVHKPLQPLHAISPSASRAELAAAIESFEGTRGQFAPRSALEASLLSRDPRTAAASRAQIVAAGFQALAARLGAQGPGRKAIVLVSEGFAAGRRRLADVANRYGVAVYVLNPSVTTDGTNHRLADLALETGGTSSTDPAEMSAVVRRVFADFDQHYVIGFEAAAPATAGFQPVTVRVERTGATVRSRAGYWPAPPVERARRSPAPPKALPFRPSHSSPFIRPWIGMTRGQDDRTTVTVVWEPGAPLPGTQQIATATVRAMGADGTVLLHERLIQGRSGRVSFDAPPGLIGLELALESSTGTRLDTDYRGLSVPNLRVTKPTLATPQFFRTRTARAFRETSQDSGALPTSARSFSRAERLLIRVPAYAAGETMPTVGARLLNREGHPMWRLEIVPSAGLPREITQFDLRLAALAPGEYRVELTATNPNGPAEQVRQTIVLRVTD